MRKIMLNKTGVLLLGYNLTKAISDDMSEDETLTRVEAFRLIADFCARSEAFETENNVSLFSEEPFCCISGLGLS